MAGHAPPDSIHEGEPLGIDDADHQSMLDRISLHVDTLSRSERKVAEAILADPSAFTEYTMARAADVAGVSEPTVMRFALSMGCDGYQAFKIALAKSLALGMPVTFSAIDVRLLPGSNGEVRYAVVTGRFHLQRSEHGAAPQDDGVFSLLWHKTPAGWKIILDHTS